jgi:hypothetical protein
MPLRMPPCSNVSFRRLVDGRLPHKVRPL